MTDRHALLIGVPNYDSDLFPSMREVVTADVTRMADALARSGYHIEFCGAGSGATAEPTAGRIKAAILRACAAVPPGGVLLVYFSGHGVTLDGESFLVPCDAFETLSGDLPACDSLVPVIPDGLRQCRARLVVFLVDACRQDPAEPATPIGGGSLSWLEDGDLALVNSCRPGEQSGYSSTGSFFTTALAEVLDRRNPARTLGEVFTAVETQMARKTARTDGLRQRPHLALATGRSGPGSPHDVVICDGDQVSEAWRRAVANTALWSRGASPEHHETVRAALLKLVANGAQQWQDAQELLRTEAGAGDAWSAHNYPIRVLTELEGCFGDHARLSPLELGMLIAAPFLREIALSAGLREAAGIGPTTFERTYRDGPRHDLEITHAMHEHVCRRAEGLARRGMHDARDALALWLVHQWLGGRAATWEAPAALQAGRRLATVLAGLPGAAVTENEGAAVLRVLTRAVGAGVEDALLLERLRRDDFAPRTRALGALLMVAGVMAADLRRMPTVVVDHVGTGSELQIATLHEAAMRLWWHRCGGTAELRAVCDHPALHEAFLDVVTRAEHARVSVASLDLDAELVGALPSRFTGNGIRPEHQDGTPAYQEPLLHFRLSEEKVRELLMGRQLYGEPELAIRELYQNALDACRYRDARRRYRRGTGHQVATWSGRITFAQGVDPAGREYVECVDNGVGMGVENLKHTFASAGERFVYRQDFRAEQARWQDADPPIRLIPNSQFGIGVFSYFMIAEEILITTRAVSADDVPAPEAHCVRIASSGSLFQITASTDMTGGGTSVRLYLTGEDRISTLRTMRRLLWLSEFLVEVTEEGAGQETWEPETLRYPDATVEPLHPTEDLWWVPGEGGLAADGIRTNEEAYGFVVNLRDKRRPQFTVDRNRLRSWDKDWVREQIQASLPALARWEGLNLAWLWGVAEMNPLIAQEVFTYLQGRSLPMGGWTAVGAGEVPLSRTGCLPLDEDICNGRVSTWSGRQRWMVTWRQAVWRDIAPVPRYTEDAGPVDVTGFPTVEPLDADVLTRIYEGPDVSELGRLGRPTIGELLGAAASDDQPMADRLRRLRRYAITGLDLRAGRDIPPLDRSFNQEDHALLPALAAWRPPDAPPRDAEVSPWLVWASARMQIPLVEVLHRVAQLAPPDWVAPEWDLRPLHDRVFGPADLRLLSRNLTNNPPWLGAQVPPSHVIRASEILGRPVADILTTFDGFAPLGFRILGRDDYPADLTAVEREALRYVPALGEALTRLHLFVVACQVRQGPAAVHAALDRLAKAGFLRLPTPHGLTDVVPNDDEARIVESELRIERFSRLPQLLPQWSALMVVVDRLTPYLREGMADRIGRYRGLLDALRPAQPIEAAGMAQLAYETQQTVGTTRQYLEILYPDDPNLVDPTLDASFDQFKVGPWNEMFALADFPFLRFSAATQAWPPLSAGRLLKSLYPGQPLGRLLDRLARYRAAGAPLPQLSEEQRDDYATFVPDQHDVDMLVEYNLAGRPVYTDRIDAFRLVQLAGRYGWTVAHAHRRLARLAPLGLTLDYEPAACPDRLVHWQDLLVVTAYLDGQEPVVASPVSAAHLSAAAAEVGESIAAVRDRIRRYAPLLGVDVPDDQGTEEEHG